MYRSRHMKVLCTALSGLLAAVNVTSGAAQERDVVSSQVEVSNSEASLLLEFTGGDRLALSFADGVATLDGEALGSFEPGDEADRAWRDLLRNILVLSDGPLARELVEWTPDRGLAEPTLALLDRVDRALADAVAGRERPRQAQREETSAEEFLAVLARLEALHSGRAADVDVESMDIRWAGTIRYPRAPLERRVLLVDDSFDGGYGSRRRDTSGRELVLAIRAYRWRGPDARSEIERRGGE